MKKREERSTTYTPQDPSAYPPIRPQITNRPDRTGWRKVEFIESSVVRVRIAISSLPYSPLEAGGWHGSEEPQQHQKEIVSFAIRVFEVTVRSDMFAHDSFFLSLFPKFVLKLASEEN